MASDGIIGMLRVAPAGACAAAAVLASPGPVRAETSRSIQVSADIVKGCQLATVSGGLLGRIDFGTIAGVGAGAVEADLVSSATAGLRIDCTPTTDAFVSADAGLHALGVQRRLASADGTSTVPYLLFADGASTPWTTQSIPLSFGTGVSRRILPIRGRALPGGAIRAGLYGDTVRLTVSW